MSDTPARVHETPAGAVVLTVTCDRCGGSMTLELSNIPPFTRQVVVSVIGTVKRATSKGSTAIAYRAVCGECARS